MPTSSRSSDRFREDFPEIGVTPLHVAAMRVQHASTAELRALVEGGTNVDAQTGAGRTALHIACRHSVSAEAVEILLRWGANETLPYEDGKTAMDVVVSTHGSARDVGGSVVRCNDKEMEAHSEVQERIRQMLARAPADRAWRRRGWLVLRRSCPVTRAQLPDERNESICPAKDPGTKNEASGGGTSDGIDVDLAQVVGALVGLEAEVLFRLVVSFL